MNNKEITFTTNIFMKNSRFKLVCDFVKSQTSLNDKQCKEKQMRKYARFLTDVWIQCIKER